MPRADETYRPSEYWRELHETVEGLSAVGYPTLPLVFNRHVYANAAHAVVRGLAAAGVELRGRTVLDVGSGSGFWIQLWLQEGAAKVAGSDLVPSAVERLRSRFPGCQITVADITQRAPYPDAGFDVVTVMSVLLHVVDKEGFGRALANLASQLAPAGRLVVLDPVVVRGRWVPASAESAHNVVRTVSEWEGALARVGLRIAKISPTASILSDPVDGRSHAAFAAHRLWWRAMTGALRDHDRLAAAVVPPLAALDRAITRRLRWGPSAKLLVVERRG